jgi:hypothetical protein
LTLYQAAAFIPVTGSGGTGALSYSITPALPGGLSIVAGTGAIAGTPIVTSVAATYTVTVTDTNGASASAAFSLSVIKQASTLSVVANPTSVTPLQSTTLTATVSATVPGTPVLPSGTVTFYANGTSLSTVLVNKGVAQLISALPAGTTQIITAVYSGDPNFLTSASSSSATVTVVPLDFTFTDSGANAYTAAPGAVASYSFGISALYGSYAGPVNFSVAGLPAGATASFTPSALTASTRGTTSVVLTIQTAAAVARNPETSFGHETWLALLLLPLGFKRSLRRKLNGRLLLWLLIWAASTAAVTGCGTSNGFLLQSPQTYTLTVTATAGAITHSQNVTLIVQ